MQKNTAYQGVNFIRITTKLVHCISHASKINNSRHPSKILILTFKSHWIPQIKLKFKESHTKQYWSYLHATHLQKHSSWLEWNFHLFGRGLLPIKNFFNVMTLNLKLIAVSDCRFQKYPDRVRKSICHSNTECHHRFSTTSDKILSHQSSYVITTLHLSHRHFFPPINNNKTATDLIENSIQISFYINI